MRQLCAIVLFGFLLGFAHTLLQQLPVLQRSNLFNNRLKDETLLRQAAKALKVREPWNAPRWVWSLAWKIQTWALPLLHRFDKCIISDSFLNLNVLWWKAISGDPFAYDLLPSFTRIVVSWPLRLLFPPLHHQNVQLRTAYLDASLRREIDLERTKASIAISGGADTDTTSSSSSSSSSSSTNCVQVITLGAGFDTRSLRFMHDDITNIKNNNNNDISVRFAELDLPIVVEQKQKLFERFLGRRRKHQDQLPVLHGADLNDVSLVQSKIESIFSRFSSSDGTNNNNAAASQQQQQKVSKTIIIVEAVLMYLKEENVGPLLREVIKTCQQHTCNKSSISLLFSDRLPGVCEDLAIINAAATTPTTPTTTTTTKATTDSAAVGNGKAGEGEEEKCLVQAWLRNNIGQDAFLSEWCPKPGRARHMGIATFS